MLYMATALMLVVALAQAAGGVVLPVYRDLLKPTPLDEAAYAERCGRGGGPLELLRPDTDRATREQLVREIDAAGVPAMAERALARAAKTLPGATVNICLVMGELSRGLPYLDGVGGVAFGGGRIKLVLHPKPKGLHRVPYTVAHEYHHEVEQNLGSGGFGPIDIMIREGKADHFAISQYPDLRPPHTNPLSDSELSTSLLELENYERGHTSPSEFSRNFMIGKNTRVLMWPGYRLGYEMVESYFRGRTVTPAQVVKTPARVIYDAYRKQGRR
jgi:hypothetical protein